MPANYTNADGLSLRIGGVSPTTYNAGISSDVNYPISTIWVDFDYANYPTFDADANNDGTLDSFSGMTPAIPARAVVTRVYLLVKAAFTGGTATGIDIGFTQKDGTAIDADGLFTAAGTGAVAGLTAGAVVIGDGALATNDAVGANNAYIKVTPNGTLTAGTGRLVVEYIEPRP